MRGSRFVVVALEFRVRVVSLASSIVFVLVSSRHPRGWSVFFRFLEPAVVVLAHKLPDGPWRNEKPATDETLAAPWATFFLPQFYFFLRDPLDPLINAPSFFTKNYLKLV